MVAQNRRAGSRFGQFPDESYNRRRVRAAVDKVADEEVERRNLTTARIICYPLEQLLEGIEHAVDISYDVDALLLHT